MSTTGGYVQQRRRRRRRRLGDWDGLREDRGNGQVDGHGERKATAVCHAAAPDPKLDARRWKLKRRSRAQPGLPIDLRSVFDRPRRVLKLLFARSSLDSSPERPSTAPTSVVCRTRTRTRIRTRTDTTTRSPLALTTVPGAPVPQCTEASCIITTIHVRLHPLGTPHAEYIRQSYSVILCHTLSYCAVRPPPAPPRQSQTPTKLHLIRSAPSPLLALPGTPIDPRASAPAADRSAPTAPTYSAEAEDGARGARRGGGVARVRARGRLRASGDEGRAGGGTASERAMIRKVRIQVRSARTPARRRPASQPPFLPVYSLARPPARPPATDLHGRRARALHRRLSKPETLREGASPRRPRAMRLRFVHSTAQRPQSCARLALTPVDVDARLNLSARSEENETARRTGGLGWTLSVCERRRTLDGPMAKSVQVAMIGRVGRCTPDPILDPVLAPTWMTCSSSGSTTAWWKNRDRAESVHRPQLFPCQEFLRSTQYIRASSASLEVDVQSHQ
ncbi:hypothetical protein HETIRDRAFT_455469 [Heterobasidion irregulare TC 32-1]|uniref:Uncharacterized protein n=1 Tax=Heterobasidion irregulare (strain TC 32-1) TaxID=747525 RepID=W4JQI8_HETIT|nr:uncharacterized protein HETIRDRAFT_455469 [Heterobasidion irregulare TC 32-1]ETW75788.1 hypothetical protein HETIRDRAFT_455469 [Heterobasidion irregulare TC 32-1]